MDWARAIETNHAALTRIVAELIAMLALMAGGPAERLAFPAYRAVLRVLRPAESAVRRLIIVAARDLVMEPSAAAARSEPKRLARSAKGSARISFQLFDPRKGFARVRSSPASKAVPRIRVIGFDPRIPMSRVSLQPVITPVREPDGTVSAKRLRRRLAAIRAALEDLPRQAKRLARWRARRERMAFVRFRSPLRPGRPPGYRSRPRHDVDHVLIECHALAFQVVRGDTS